MLIDTHCHLNIATKQSFDTPLGHDDLISAQTIIESAKNNDVGIIINVGTSLIESVNCIALAQRFESVYATIGIHPNDLSSEWSNDLKQLEKYLKDKEQHKIVGIGECGLDRHYPNPDMQRQKDAFKAQIDLALQYDVALVVHTRDAREETLEALLPYSKQITKGIIHCFSEDIDFAKTVIDWNFAIGIGATITYPKNSYLRQVVTTVALQDIVLETDAPYLPPQELRGKKNFPAYIKITAEYLAQLRNESYEQVAQNTTKRALKIFNIHA